MDGTDGDDQTAPIDPHVVGTARRAELMLALSALPVSDAHAYVRDMAATITRAFRIGADDVTADVLLLDEEGLALTPLQTPGAPPDAGSVRLPLREDSPLAHTFLSGVPYLLADGRDVAGLPAALAAGVPLSLLAVPLDVAGKRRGVLYLTSRFVGGFRPQDQDLLAVVASRIGLLIEQAEVARHRAEAVAEQAQQTRLAFLSLISHELKTPVTVIAAYAELLHERAVRDGDGEAVRMLTEVEKQSARLGMLIDDLLDVQRLEGDVLILKKSRVELGALAREIVRAHGGAIWVESAIGQGSTFHVTLPLTP